MFSNMKKLALVAVLATFSVTSAVAADLPAGMYGKAAPSAVYNWGGFYLGADVGGAFTGPTATSNFVQDGASQHRKSVVARGRIGCRSPRRI